MKVMGLLLIEGDRLATIDDVLRKFPCVKPTSVTTVDSWHEALSAITDPDIKVIGRFGDWTYVIDCELRLAAEASVCRALAEQLCARIVAVTANDEQDVYYLSAYGNDTSRRYLQTAHGVLENVGRALDLEKRRPVEGWNTTAICEALRTCGFDLDRISEHGPYLLRRTAEPLLPPAPDETEADPLEELAAEDRRHWDELERLHEDEHVRERER
jgi:hypothetical protein